MKRKSKINYPKVSIIVLNYNGKQHIKECFDSLKKINYPKSNYEVIMVDNNSQDNSVEYTKNKYPWIKILELKKNYGFARGNNKGARFAKGEYLAFLNSDTSVDKDWVSGAINVLLEKKLFIGSSLMLDYYNKDKVLVNNLKKTSFGSFISEDSGKKIYKMDKEIKFTFHPSGAGMFIKKTIFLKLKGFDENYFMYGEDMSLGWNAWTKGYNIISIPSSIYWHKVRGSSKKSERSDFYLFNLWKNRLSNLFKYPQKKISVFSNIFFYSLIYSFGSIVLFCFKGKFSNAFSICKANFSFFRDLKKNKIERKKIQSKRIFSDKEIYKKGISLGFFKSIKETIKSVINMV